MGMTVGQRLNGVKKWLDVNACNREMKAQGKKDLEVIYRKPFVKLMLFSDEAGLPQEKYGAPGILVLMKESGMQDPERRFDQYKNMKRSRIMAGAMPLQMIFVTVDPGHRTEESQENQTNDDIEANDEEAFITALEWAETTMNALIEAGHVEGTDLTIRAEDIRFGPLMQYGVLVDRRPLYYAVIEGVFGYGVQQQMAGQGPGASQSGQRVLLD